MSKARDVMHSGAECIGENGTLSRAAEMMRDLHVGSLPICGEDGKLHGIISEADLAQHLPQDQLKRFADAVYSAPPNS